MSSSSFSAVFRKVRARGFGWFSRRVAEEWRVPSTPLGRRLRSIQLLLVKLFGLPLRLANRSAKETTKTLTLFYDLKVVPLTYDFATALCLAEVERRKLDLESIRVVFVPAENGILRKDSPEYERVIDERARDWRFWNLVLPLCSLVDSVGSVSWCKTREEGQRLERNAAHVFPEDYSVGFPSTYPLKGMYELAQAGHEVKVLRAPRHGLRYVERWLKEKAGDRPVVTITLRNYGYGLARNCNLDAWCEFIKTYEDKGFFIIVLDDPDPGGSDLPDDLRAFCRFPEAVWNVGLRISLYQLSAVNLGVNSGVMNLCLYNALARYILLKMETDSVAEAKRELLELRGFYPGHNPAYAGPFQKIVWADDEYSTICDAFETLWEEIQRSENTLPPQHNEREESGRS